MVMQVQFSHYGDRKLCHKGIISATQCWKSNYNRQKWPQELQAKWDMSQNTTLCFHHFRGALCGSLEMAPRENKWSPLDGAHE